VTFQVQELGTVCTYINRGAAPAYTEADDLLVLNQKCVRNGRVSYSEARYTDPTKKKVLTDRFLHELDILVNSTGVGTLGRVGQILQLLKPMTVDSHVTIVRADSNIVDPLYLGYVLRSSQPSIENLAEGSTGQTELSRAQLRELPIPLPSREEQQAIASILGTLDDKIELNRRMNETLEEMAQALFKSWFVDFDPVRSKIEGRQPVGMDDETAALFPDSFEDSTLGEIPKGWTARALSDVVEVNPRRSLSKGESAPHLDMKSMPIKGHYPAELTERDFGSGTKFTRGDTLLARITPCLENGKTAFVDFLNDGQVGWGSTEYIVLRPKPPLPMEYAYYLARSESLRTYAIQNMVGSSGRQRVPAQCFDSYFVVVPSEDVALRFGETAAQLMSKIRANHKQSATLADIRDTLLPKLLSGEVRVGEAEEIVKEIV
jgi:type I restriction enzyme S subunit